MTVSNRFLHIQQAYLASFGISLDDMWFATNSIIDLVEYHYVNGGTHLFLDEIHKCAHLNFEGILSHPVISLEDLLTKHVSIASDITETIRIIPHFKNYCKYG